MTRKDTRPTRREITRRGRRVTRRRSARRKDAAQLPDSLHDAFAEHAKAHASRIAVWARDEHLSYGELDDRSTRLARELIWRGANVESRIGLCLDRDPLMIVGMLGILKSGAAYVPIDPDYPGSRIEYIVQDSGVTAIVASQQTAACVRSCGVAVVDVRSALEGNDHCPVAVAARSGRGNLAYVIYTSGSTGHPKGVMVEHGSVLRLFERTCPVFNFDHTDVWSQFHSISFDFSVWEIWGALLTGARLVIVPSRIARAPREFRSYTDQQQITILNQTPTAFREFSQASLRAGRGCAPLRIVIFGGEALPMRLVEPWISRYGDERPMLFNMYGITETTVHVTYTRLMARHRGESDSRIGIPIDDLQVRLLDAQGQPVPHGTPGRVCVAGPGVARGYLNRPGLTAHRFFAHTGEDGRASRFYDSGDLAVCRDSGELVYLGRYDDQLKISGYRIEPREVECCLTRHPAVAAAVVVPEALGPDVTGLVAYIMLDDGPRTPADHDEIAAALASSARAELPVYMRPCDYRFIASLPLTVHSKVDRRALMASLAASVHP